MFRLYFVLIILYILPSPLRSDDDIWFSLPSNGQPVTGNLTIKIYPPMHRVPIRLWLEEDRTERIVWSATVLPEYDYTIVVDTTRLNPGKHELNAVYYFNGEEYEGEIDIEINSL